MKDALGHGSESNGAHSAPINNLPSKGTSWSSGVSDATWHAQQPIAQYTGHVSDLLGMWGGGGMSASKLSPSESAQLMEHYNKRTDPHVAAASLHAQRSQVSAQAQKTRLASAGPTRLASDPTFERSPLTGESGRRN